MPVARVCLIGFAALTAFCNSHAVHWTTQRAMAQKASSVFRGTWKATADPTQILRGTWSGQTLAHSPNTAWGSWTLLNEASEIFLRGTWSAQKVRQGWQGSWTARTPNGRSLSGAWTGDLQDFSVKTFQEMLERTAATEVAGSWRSGRKRGNWWLNR